MIYNPFYIAELDLLAFLLRTFVSIIYDLYLKQVINKDLLYSTGNSAQHSVMT